MNWKREREKLLKLIRRNIERSGYHVYVVSGGSVPRWCYTIGFKEALGGELVLAGAMDFDSDDLNPIFEAVRSAGVGAEVEVPGRGKFAVQRAHDSWVRKMCLGAFDHYGTKEVDAFQIVPQGERWTIDTPEMGRERTIGSQAAWKWLDAEWDLPVPEDSTAAADMAVLRGGAVNQVVRWEKDYWEMFSCESPEKDDCRMATLGTLLAHDPSLSRALDLDIGQGLLRDADGAWHLWD